ncbi:MAG: YbaK/EbsC family protein [Candidatus Methanofastidiosa archaeon]|nr:YbaK/EbsC family protein [Candidatus Methanofastidiosa archaeon]
MLSNLKKKAEIVQTALNELGIELNVVQLAASTRSAQEAAAAVGCTLGQIAKSLVFKGETSQKPILIIVSGKNRVNEKVVEAMIKEKLQKADADFVVEQTGFSIGGVPPVGHKNPIPIYIDQDIMQYEEIWAAAGTPNAVFKLTPKILVEITKGKIISIK